MDMKGRKRPYTELGILRVSCSRCGKPSKFQWQCCATGNRWMGVCENCDILLNEMVLRFFRIRGWRAMLKKYIDKVKR